MREGEKRGDAERKRKEQRRRRKRRKTNRGGSKHGRTRRCECSGPGAMVRCPEKRRGAPRRRRRNRQRSVEVSSKVSSQAAECNMSARL